MNLMEYVPVYGPTKKTLEIQLGYQTGEISLIEGAYESALTGAISAAQLIAAVHIAPNYLAVNKIQRVVTKGPGALLVGATAIAVLETTRPSADVESTDFGAFRVTPRLGYL